MDFSKSNGAENKKSLAGGTEVTQHDASIPLDGDQLIQAVVSLTGLPDHCVPLVNRQMTEILSHSGQDSSQCTLDDLRAAMLAYLESIHQDFEIMSAEDQLDK